jgi:hypothetical protein
MVVITREGKESDKEDVKSVAGGYGSLEGGMMGVFQR